MRSKSFPSLWVTATYDWGSEDENDVDTDNDEDWYLNGAVERWLDHRSRIGSGTIMIFFEPTDSAGRFTDRDLLMLLFQRLYFQHMFVGQADRRPAWMATRDSGVAISKHTKSGVWSGEREAGRSRHGIGLIADLGRPELLAAALGHDLAVLRAVACTCRALHISCNDPAVWSCITTHLLSRPSEVWCTSTGESMHICDCRSQRLLIFYHRDMTPAWSTLGMSGTCWRPIMKIRLEHGSAQSGIFGEDMDRYATDKPTGQSLCFQTRAKAKAEAKAKIAWMGLTGATGFKFTSRARV